MSSWTLEKGEESVMPTSTKEPFPKSLGIPDALHSLALGKGVALLPGTGTADEVCGEYAPVVLPYNVCC